MEKIDVHNIDKEHVLTKNEAFCMFWCMHLTPDGNPPMLYW